MKKYKIIKEYFLNQIPFELKDELFSYYEDVVEAGYQAFYFDIEKLIKPIAECKGEIYETIIKDSNKFVIEKGDYPLMEWFFNNGIDIRNPDEYVLIYIS